MYFVTGGSFNGKARWIKDELLNSNDNNVHWQTLFNTENELVDPLSAPKEDIVVFEGLEFSILKRLTNERTTSKLVREAYNQLFFDWNEWEKEDDNRLVIWIGSDISKGIVPMEAHNRLWRDTTGWVYQDLAKIANKVIHMWYGIPTTLK